MGWNMSSVDIYYTHFVLLYSKNVPHYTLEYDLNKQRDTG